MTPDLHGKVAVVTGAGQGVGRRIAMSLAECGAAVAVNDLFKERADAVVSEIHRTGGAAVAAPADISDADAVKTMFVEVREAIGRVAILVNNAGVPAEMRAHPAPRPLFYESPLADQHKMVAINLHGAMYACREALSHMVSLQWGRIVNIVSEAGRAGEARLAAYAAAKAGVVGLTKSLAQEHGRDAINVNAIALGATSHEGILSGPLSPVSDHADEAWRKMASRYPMARGLGRLGAPEDAAAAVLFLVSDGAAFITGQTLGVSGGFFMP